MNTPWIRPGADAPSAAPSWLASDAGRRALAARAEEAARAFLEDGLAGRLERERTASLAGGSKVFRVGNSLRRLTEEMMILALARGWGAAVPEEAWEKARAVWNFALGMESLTFQGRNEKPPWRADLWTADIGLSLAFAAGFDTPLEPDRDRLRDFLETRCWNPIRADWLDDATRIHSLDSMGHNWWPVIVGGAGVMAALLGWTERARDICEQLRAWFRYPGNDAFRKRPNFGAEGDYVEGFAYGEYALLRPCQLAFVLPECRPVPDWLDLEQCAGLTDWYRNAFVETHKGFWPQRFGDVSLGYLPNAAVWHTLARLSGDAAFLAWAHRLLPRPRTAFDLLMWEPPPDTAPEPARARPASRRVFPVSGLAFLGGERLSATVRAGEFWNHNHLDAGSFIFRQDGVVWVDDSGTCAYSLPEYTGYYTSPRAHNVAFAPELAPPNARAQYLGMELQGRLLAHEQAGGVEALHVDTGALAGGRLARARRRFLVLDGDVLVVWDELEGFEPHAFEFLLHTTHAVAPDFSAIADGEGRRCPLAFFSDAPCRASTEPAPMGEITPHDPFAHGGAEGVLMGTCLRWRGDEKTERRKFLLAMGVELRSARWTEMDSGWECVLETGAARWSLWFNRLADGRLAHANTIGVWRGFETDASVLLLRESGGGASLAALDASFARSVETGGMRTGGLMRRTFLPPAAVLSGNRRAADGKS